MNPKLWLLVPALLAISPSALAEDDPLSGRWELSVEKSRYDPGPAPLYAMRIQYVEGDELKVSLEITPPHGRSEDAQYTAKLDGKHHPAGRDPKSGTIAWTRIDARTLEYQRKRDGQVVETGRLQVTADGNELILTAKGVNAAGKSFNDRVVYDRWVLDYGS
jgi:hypothetical protein